MAKGEQFIPAKKVVKIECKNGFFPYLAIKE